MQLQPNLHCQRASTSGLMAKGPSPVLEWPLKEPEGDGSAGPPGTSLSLALRGKVGPITRRSRAGLGAEAQPDGAGELRSSESYSRDPWAGRQITNQLCTKHYGKARISTSLLDKARKRTVTAGCRQNPRSDVNVAAINLIWT